MGLGVSVMSALFAMASAFWGFFGKRFDRLDDAIKSQNEVLARLDERTMGIDKRVARLEGTDHTS